ncbi:SAM-dependent methyltransferase [Cupriavidus metallidurans]|uniref:SAM-dependent methyltransferase n=1 Tax=Cupriavidus metallidurans TaxID=119219 RepID=UPI001BFC9AE0|nr:cyclopropane-fatty-acyl-phospholipid synthase family protein [Cupriavidus metallidurans]QWC92657.1 class I SAM-dependent methyltransferase [Cupriavidus metallidurans]
MTLTTSLPLDLRQVPSAGRLLLNLLRRIVAGSLVLVTPRGETIRLGEAGAVPSAELHIHDWRACARILASGDIGFAESLRDRWVDCHDLTSLLRLAIINGAALERAIFGNGLARLWLRLRHLLRRNSRTGSRRNIQAHYDLGNAFYRLWLDPGMTYSSALFDGDFSMSLDAAQHAKYRRIWERVGGREGMRVLEIGCGWGGFMELAAGAGASVHGITLSEQQYAYARERLEVWPQAEVALRDYRDVSGQYDAIVSIEMFEAVGEAYWPVYFDTLRRCLRPGARALVQSITIEEAQFERYRSGSDFIQQFIFPGGMLPSRERFAVAAQRHGLRVAERHDFGRDYAETLRRWRAAFEDTKEQVLAQGFDEAFLRIWRLYLCYCEAGFSEGRIGVSQFLLERG